MKHIVYDLRVMWLDHNQLTTLTLPDGLNSLTTVELEYNQLTSLNLPSDLNNVTLLDLHSNQLTTLTLATRMRNLRTLDLADNPLTELALPAGIPNLQNPDVQALRANGVQVTLFPLLKPPRRGENGNVTLDLFGDEGVVTVLRSIDAATWTEVGTVTITTPNYPGATFVDPTVGDQDKAFYRFVQ